MTKFTSIIREINQNCANKRTNYLKYTRRSKGINLWNELELRFKGIKNYYICL